MHPDIPGEPLQPPCQVEEFLHLLFLVVTLLELGHLFQRLVEADILARRRRDHLRQLIAEVVRQFQHTPHIAHHCTRRQGAKSDDLRHRIGTVFVTHIVDYAIPLILTKVDIKVRHRHPLRVQKALEQQGIAQRIKIGDAQTVGHQRTCTGATPRPHRNPILFCPVDKVGHNQKVTRETHLDDGRDLQFEPLAIHRLVLLTRGRIRVQAQHPGGQARPGLLTQVIFKAHAGRGRKVRQATLAQLQRQVAAPRNRHAIGQRLGQIGKTLGHLGLR